jgi:hypothetical protein
LASLAASESRRAGDALFERSRLASLSLALVSLAASESRRAGDALFERSRLASLSLALVRAKASAYSSPSIASSRRSLAGNARGMFGANRLISISSNMSRIAQSSR